MADYLNGTVQQQAWFEEVLATSKFGRLATPGFPEPGWSFLDVQIEVEWVADPSPGMHNEFAYTTNGLARTDGSLTGSRSAIKLRQDLGSSNTDKDLFYDVAHHELGHVAVGQALTVPGAEAKLRGCLLADPTHEQWEAGAWHERALEGVAEAFKDVFSARRKYDNRTQWKLRRDKLEDFEDAFLDDVGQGGGLRTITPTGGVSGGIFDEWGGVAPGEFTSAYDSPPFAVPLNAGRQHQESQLASRLWSPATEPLQHPVRFSWDFDLDPGFASEVTAPPWDVAVPLPWEHPRNDVWGTDGVSGPVVRNPPMPLSGVVIEAGIYWKITGRWLPSGTTFEISEGTHSEQPARRVSVGNPPAGSTGVEWTRLLCLPAKIPNIGVGPGHGPKNDPQLLARRVKMTYVEQEVLWVHPPWPYDQGRVLLEPGAPALVRTRERVHGAQAGELNLG